MAEISCGIAVAAYFELEIICTKVIPDMDCIGKGVTTVALWCICTCTPPLIGPRAAELRSFGVPRQLIEEVNTTWFNLNDFY